MNPYERLINVIREQGSVKNPPRLRLGTMASDSQCDIGTMVLEKDDLYIAEHLTDRYTVKITANALSMRLSGYQEQQEASMANQEIVVNSSLKKGDVVLLYKVSDEKYVVIEKVVSP